MPKPTLNVYQNGCLGLSVGLTRCIAPLPEYTKPWTLAIALSCNRLWICEILQAADKTLTQRLFICFVARPQPRQWATDVWRCKDTFFFNFKPFYDFQWFHVERITIHVTVINSNHIFTAHFWQYRNPKNTENQRMSELGLKSHKIQI